MKCVIAIDEGMCREVARAQTLKEARRISEDLFHETGYDHYIFSESEWVKYQDNPWSARAIEGFSGYDQNKAIIDEMDGIRRAR